MAKKTILVVDDEEDILELVRFHLAREGYTVLSAETGEQAWRIAREQHVDLALVDLMLPGIDGLELTRRFKNDSKTSSIPVVMLTAKGEEVDIVTGLELGADDYVTKPFSPRVLLARVRAVFRRRSVPVLPRAAKWCASVA
jgi:two-component system, OmpR family, alkaline phosphatase synthesis response regulator PhoP